MEPIPCTVKVGNWTHPRSFLVTDSLVRLGIVIPGCNCMTCIEHLCEITYTLKSKGIRYYPVREKPDGWAIAIDLKGAQDPIKHMSDAIGLPIKVR